MNVRTPVENRMGHDHAEDVTPPSPTQWRKSPGLMVRGGLVGVAEAVPGISGGTVSLVVGIYDRLIDAAGDTISGIKFVLTGRFSKGWATWKTVDWRFILPIIAGMSVGLIAALMTVAPLLEDHPTQTRAVLFGMIAVSVLVPLRMMRQRMRPVDWVLLVAGVVTAAILTSLPQSQVGDPSLWLVLFGTAIAINALVVPGLSGSFILMAMGLYIPVQHAVSDRDMAFIGVFFLGAVIGLSVFVKRLQWLLHHKRQATLAVLAGLMIGSLRALWPWQDDDRMLQAPEGHLGIPILLAIIGALIVTVALIVEARAASKQDES
ncbi:DUF368 domain-containing protein [Natronoglycomyces albus]|uniref:DUF368 domain-containing protein n=1 Tax=Natronoglycomyces albus TaxID=2811108 RepID=A0A895XT72_9ACTN|nr:DUF368 domain-containing protein [Natronoglycomyces albus]QSB05460.1 DUF368 domain-containing protein [Natronoglycomyces albus]